MYQRHLLWKVGAKGVLPLLTKSGGIVDIFQEETADSCQHKYTKVGLNRTLENSQRNMTSKNEP